MRCCLLLPGKGDCHVEVSIMDNNDVILLFVNRVAIRMALWATTSVKVSVSKIRIILPTILPDVQ